MPHRRCGEPAVAHVPDANTVVSTAGEHQPRVGAEIHHLDPIVVGQIGDLAPVAGSQRWTTGLISQVIKRCPCGREPRIAVGQPQVGVLRPGADGCVDRAPKGTAGCVEQYDPPVGARDRHGPPVRAKIEPARLCRHRDRCDEPFPGRPIPKLDGSAAAVRLEFDAVAGLRCAGRRARRGHGSSVG